MGADPAGPETSSSSRDIGTESVVFAKTLTMRKLTSSGSSNSLRRGASAKRLESATPTTSPATRRSLEILSPMVRRPATAALTHSRIHQALRRTAGEFVFSSKESTVDGFLYTSRFQQNTLLPQRHGTSQLPAQRRTKPRSALQRKASAASENHGTSDPAADMRDASATAPESSPAPMTGSSPSAKRTSSSRRSLSREPADTDREPPGRVAQQQHLQKHGQHPQEQQRPAKERKSPSKPEDAPGVKNDEGAFILRKRRCARTFEEMIAARVLVTEGHARGANGDDDNNNADKSSTTAGIQKLLDDGIIPSVLALCGLADAATQSHCCRAFYHLARSPVARKIMVAEGVVTAIKSLVRSTTARSRQDLAATLCHLTEEHSLIEMMMFEGVDRTLLRLFTANAPPETKRICALAVFNISSDASKLKHFVESFSQLLFAATKSCVGCPQASTYLIKAVYNVALFPMFHASLLGENIPKFLAAQLPSGDDPSKLLALQALIALCDVKANRPQVLSQNVCRLLESMLLGTADAEVQEMALLVLLSLSIDEGSRIKLCNWVPAGTIVRAAVGHLEQLGRTVAAAEHPHRRDRLVLLDSCIFRNLCDSVLTHHELVEEGLVPMLLEMSRLADHDIKSNAVCALCSIIANATDESAQFVVGIIDELILLSRSSQPATISFAVGAIYNIACSDDCLAILSASEGLLTRLLEIAATPPPQEDVVELTVATLYRLASIDELRSRLLSLGIVATLTRLARPFPSCRCFAINTLLLMVQDPNDIFPHGSDEVRAFIAALGEEPSRSSATAGTRSGSGNSAQIESGEAAVARSAVTLLAHLAQDRRNHALFATHDGVWRFLRSLRRIGDQGEETVVINSAFVYYTLTVTHEGCEQLIREQGIEELIHLSRTSRLGIASNHHVRELFMMTMCRLASFMGLEVRLIEHGAIDAVLVLALVTTDHPAIKALCIKTLANCLVAKNCVRPLIDHGVIWALASLAGVDRPETRFACAVALCNLATVPHMLGRFLDANVPKALVQLLQRSVEDPATVLVLIKAIANLVASEKICLAFMNEDIERCLAQRFADPQSTDEIRQLAAMILLRITSVNDALSSLEHLRNGVFAWMEQIIAMEDRTLVRNCMLTVHDLTCNAGIDVAALDVHHILRIVIQVVHRHGPQSHEIVTLCLSILYNISCQLGALDKLVQPEIMALLRYQVPLADVSEASWGSTSVPRADGSAVPGAVPTAVVHTAHAPPPGMGAADMKLCCLILHNLSCAREIADGTTTVLAALVNARATRILVDIYHAREDLKEMTAMAVANLAIGRVNSSRVVDDHGGRLLVDFVFSKGLHRCHAHLLSVALRRLLNAPGNQPSLVAAGVVAALVRLLVLTGDATTGHEAIRNVTASLCLLSKCSDHLPRMLADGTLPAVIRLSETEAPPEVHGACFELLSNLCAVNFAAHAPEINVIATLTRLSEAHPSGSTTASSLTSSVAGETRPYYARGDDGALPFGQLLTFMLKAPSGDVKKNLELQSTFAVPARKWLPEAEPRPREPPPPDCNEIPLTEGNQAIPSDIRQRIRGLAPLAKEPLVRDERSAAIELLTTTTTTSDGGSGGGGGSDSGGVGPLALSESVVDDSSIDGPVQPGPGEGGGGLWRSLLEDPRVFVAPTAGKRSLHRADAGRNLSLAMVPTTRGSLIV